MNNTATTLDIMVFATGVTSVEQANIILEKLLLHDGVKQANFDMEDVDNILRVVSSGITEREVEQILLQQRLWCRTLA
ncbi:hypothetical protein SAMN04487906_2200 [Zhouia amylolytica]|uniref:Uncharacterized protein n=2 Tax=Zhouia amylolytica TaxID=376730 RepID=A0A1I6TX27_9FLAO|nr:hypothetical protein SAMN04487906_2200 [Zhouia amylolytica]